MLQGLYHLFAALGWALFNSFWQMGTIWLLIIIYRWLHPVHTNTSKNLASFLGLVTGFIAFIVTFAIALFIPTSSFRYPVFNGEWIQPVFNYGTSLYLVLLIFPLRNIFRSSLDVYRLRSGRERIPGSLKIFALDAANYLNIKRKVQLFASSKITSPLTVGFLKPVILLPVAVINQLSLRQLEAIILHELAHIKNNDYLINLTNQAILTILYFNPFARLLVKMQELDREQSADRWVTQFQYEPYLYASTLLQLARNQAAINPLTLHVSGKESQLEQRVQTIMGIAGKRTVPLKKILILAIFLAVSGGYYYSGNTSGVLAVPVQTPYIVPAAAPVVAAADEPAPPKNKIKIIPIPVTEPPDSKPANNTVYLKITEGPDGKIEAPVKPAPIADASPLFAANTTIVAPELDSAAEHNVQESMKTFRQIITELAWTKIENSLAETVPEDQKKALKAQIAEAFDKLNWDANVNKLRSLYNEINWARAEAQLNAQLSRVLSTKAEADHHLAKKIQNAKSDLRQLRIKTDSVTTGIKSLDTAKATAATVIKDSSKKIADL